MGAFFIHRPVFAWVVAIVTMLAGAAAIMTLPVAQYPDIAPTSVRVSATYSGASASTVENSVTRVLEDQMTGLDGLLYMTASSSEGSASLSLTFDGSIDPIDAQNDVQTRVSRVESQLPSSVRQQGVSVSRSTSSILMVVQLTAPEGGYDSVQLGNLYEEIVDGPIQRVEGVGSVNQFGSGYAMRIWLDPLSLHRFGLTPDDVVSAVEAQNTNVAVGSLGAQPTVRGQQFTATVSAQSQLTSVPEFEGILIDTEEDGSAIYLGDVARIEIGQEDYGGDSRLNGNPSAGFSVSLATGANAVDTADAVYAELDRLEGALPAGVEFAIAYDTTPFVELSIEQVYHTLAEAVVLVFLVLLAFLQTWRATLIPIVAVPVVLLGTFVALSVTGFSINTLTLFAMVLAIGLLVDDAIVVVENVERVMDEEDVGPVAATAKSMGEITGALIGIVVVLSAVFLPMAFFGGSTGVIYRQFSITIISAMALSLAVAIILTPALCATILRKRAPGAGGLPARVFNRGFDGLARAANAAIRPLTARPILAGLILALTVAGCWGVYSRMTSSFLPTEDQGVLMAQIRLPEGSTTQATEALVEQLETYVLEEESEAVASISASLGFSFGGGGQNTAMAFIRLKDFDARAETRLGAAAVAGRINAKFMASRRGQIFVMQPPAVRGLGNSGGFSFYLTDIGGNGVDALLAAADEFVARAEQDGRLTNIRASGTEKESALKLSIDQQKAQAFGIGLADLNSMLSIVFAGSEVNDFVLNDQLRPVIVQGDAPFRMQPEDMEVWYARNSDGEMVPFDSLISTSWEPVSPRLQRYGGTAAVEISGSAAEGWSSGDAMDAAEEIAEALEGGYGVDWTGISYQERQSGDQAPLLYALSALIVFLALAALYESWAIPFAVMLAVPVGVLGALGAAYVFGQSNDVYFKVGMLTTIGLAARNAILIVEFAETLIAGGMDALEAARTAAAQRLRPIMMTALTFILGVLPLAIATGAGAASQNAIGIGVIGGMILSTFLGYPLTPALYILVRRIARMDRRTPATEAKA